MIQFNTGVMIATPNGGNLGANPTPTVLGILQEGSFDVSWELKELYGQFQFPVDVATGKGKVTGTAKFAAITGKTVGDLFFGQGVAAPANLPVYLENHAIPGTPYQVTITPPAGGTFLADLGVLYGASGQPFQNVGSGSLTAAGQYKVNVGTGVYTFDVADTAVAGGVNTSYLYTAATGIGLKTVVANQLMGYGPIFEMDFFVTYETQTFLMRAYNCKMTKWGNPTKQGDYLIQDISYSAFANPAGNVFELDYSTAN
jgi:hypothetical protein